MAGKRKRKRPTKVKKKKTQKYIPIVVLNNQIPVEKANNDNLDPRDRGRRIVPPRRRRYRHFYRPRKSLFYVKNHSQPNPSQSYSSPSVAVMERRFGDSFYNNGINSKSDLDISESNGGYGGCSSRSGGSFDLGTGEALIFLAALAFAVSFLNLQIKMLLPGGKRRKRRSIKMDELENSGTTVECSGEKLGSDHVVLIVAI
jgi:hypothetical protein